MMVNSSWGLSSPATMERGRRIERMAAAWRVPDQPRDDHRQNQEHRHDEENGCERPIATKADLLETPPRA
jgi:hypothetical protein